ncbi:MAG TPA: GSU2403 family nucleotidyltransferase fold protein [Rhodocyclaceae bacterium]|nr:GSU2403 family nucleotidyltransferase fold protein [Rhodocyclaceae bacterium]
MKLATPLGKDGFLALLKQTGIRFAPVTGLERPPGPPTSFKAVGKDLKVDLLVPGRLNSKPYATVSVPELGAHATSLPFLDYLLQAPWPGLAGGRDHLIPIAIPQPARYALHKLVIAGLRGGAENPKIEKDLTQAGILAAILAQEDPSALEDAAAKLTPSMRRHAVKSLPRWTGEIMGEEHAGAAQLVADLLGLAP